MTRALNWVALRRHIPAVAWVAGILLVQLGFWWRGSSSGLVAVRDMAANHAITAADLKTSETAALVDHYLRQSVKAGDPITPSMVSGQLLPTNDDSIAAVVRIPAAMKMKRGIEVGSVVLIYVGAEQFGPPGRVIQENCDEQICSVVVSLPKTPGRIIDPALVANADLVPAATQSPAASGH